MVDIVVVRTANSIVYDPRVKKIVRSLSKKYSISVLGWNRDGISREKIDNYVVKMDLYNLKTSTWQPSLIRIITRLIIFFPPFWIWVFIKLLASRPKVIHACDLDSIFPSYMYKVLFRRKLVFDVFDRYALTFVPKRFRILYRIINFTEELFSKHSDVLIVANGEGALRTFQKKPDHCEIVMNYPEDSINHESKPLKKNKTITVAFTGHIRRQRGLETLIAVMRDLVDVELVITGRNEDEQLFDQIQGLPNIKYPGLLDDVELLKVEQTSDIMVAFYDPEFFSANMPLPNKLFEAMMFSIPIVTNVGREIVNETDCGIVVDYENIEQIKKAIVTLRDDAELRKRLGNNGRQAFLEKYNWAIMEKRLYNVYENLI